MKGTSASIESRDEVYREALEGAIADCAIGEKERDLLGRPREPLERSPEVADVMRALDVLRTDS